MRIATIISSILLGLSSGTIFDDAVPDSTLLNDASLQVANIKSWKAVNAHGDWMVASGSRAGVWKYNSATSKYDDFQAAFTSSAGGVCKVARSSDHIVCSHFNGNDAYRYIYSGTAWSWPSRNKLAGDTSFCQAGHPCDNVAITDDGNFVFVGWASVLDGGGPTAQRGFIRFFDCRNKASGASCSAIQWANSDKTNTGQPWHNGRGKNGDSYHGMSIDVVEDPYTADSSWAMKHLIVSGAPGDTDGIGAGQENPDVSQEGTGRVGGYVQISLTSEDIVGAFGGRGIRPVIRHWAPAAYDHSGNRFGAMVRISRDGMRMVVTAPGQHADGTTNEVGAFYVYSNDGDNTFSLEAGPYFGPAQDEDFGWSLDIDDSGDRIFVGAPRARTGDGAVYTYHKSGAGEWSLQGDTIGDSARSETDCGEGIAWDSQRGELHVGCPGFDNVVTDEGLMLTYDLPDAPTASPTASPTVPPACTVSTDCGDVDEYCSASSTCETTACTGEDHSQCEGIFKTGRLPYCHKSGYCRDIGGESTCGTTETCALEQQRAKHNSNSVGKIAVAFGGDDVEAQRDAVQTQIDFVKGNSTVSSDVEAYVNGTVDVSLGSAFFEEIASNDDALAAIENATCGDKKDFCTATITGATGLRRQLQAQEEITVTVTFDIDEATFDAIIENNPSVDDPTFAAALAAAAGISADNVTITATDGELVVTYVLVQETSGAPLGDNVLDEIDSLQDNLDNVTDAIVAEFNITSGDIEATELDPCDGRDCNGFGAELCNSVTGACACPSGYWGINCDETCTCLNGGSCPENQCQCLYPYFDYQCGTISTDCSDGTCA